MLISKVLEVDISPYIFSMYMNVKNPQMHYNNQFVSYLISSSDLIKFIK